MPPYACSTSKNEILLKPHYPSSPSIASAELSPSGFTPKSAPQCSASLPSCADHRGGLCADRSGRPGTARPQGARAGTLGLETCNIRELVSEPEVYAVEPPVDFVRKLMTSHLHLLPRCGVACLLRLLTVGLKQLLHRGFVPALGATRRFLVPKENTPRGLCVFRALYSLSY